MLDVERQALQALSDANGGILTPDAVVRSARPRNSPLHDRFTWDDKLAGAAHRLNEARQLIRMVTVEIKIDKVTVSTPYFVRDPTLAPSQGYRSLGALRSDDDLAREAVIAEFKRASGALARARAIAAALEIADEITGLEEQLGLLIGRATSAGASQRNLK